MKNKLDRTMHWTHRLPNGRPSPVLTVMPNAKRHRTTMNRQTKHRTESQRFVKLKEVQSYAQSQRICTTFNFAPTHPSPPTTQIQLLTTSLNKNI